MSYEIVRGMTVNFEDLSIKFRCSSNNVSPKYFTPWLYEFKRGPSANLTLKDKEIFVLELIQRVVGGSYQLQYSVNKNIRWAFLKLLDDYENDTRREGKLYSYISGVVGGTQEDDYARELAYEFESYCKAKDHKIEKVILLDRNRYFKGFGRGKCYTAWTKESAVVITSQKELDLTLDRLNNNFEVTATVEDVNKKNELNSVNELELER